MWRRGYVIPESISRQGQTVDRIHDFVGVQPSVGVVWVFIIELKFNRLWDSIREVEPFTTVKRQVLATSVLIRLRVIFLDEPTCSTDEIEPHQFAPIVGIRALFKSRKRTNGSLMPPYEFRFSNLLQVLLWSDSKVLVTSNKQLQLRGKIDIGLVVRRGGQKNALAAVLLDVLLNHFVPFALAVPEVVALIDQHDAVTWQIR